MAKFELTVSSDYVPSWGVYEGIREAVQNALDAQDDGHPMTIIPPTATNPTLSILSQGAQLNRAVWLMGVTSKSSGGYRGCYGEGLVLGTLALARAGRRVSLVNGSEGWRVALEFSKAFPDQRVLTIYTRKLATDAGGFGVRIQCSIGEWAEYSKGFLDLQPDVQRLDADQTEILLGDDQRGRCYVKGILVETRDNMAAGYNFKAAGVDRDRRMIDSWDVDYYSANAWLRALHRGEVEAETILDLLESDSADSRGFRNICVPLDAEEKVAAVWAQRYGDNVIPVSSEAEVKEAGHLGKIGRIAPADVILFFRDYTPLSLAKLRADNATSVTRYVATEELTNQELNNLAHAIELVRPAAKKMGIASPLNRLSVVEFSNPDVLGVHLTADGVTSIQIARRPLDSLADTVRTLVHEVAHEFGSDGSVSHERAEGKLFGHIIAEMSETMRLFVHPSERVPQEAAA